MYFLRREQWERFRKIESELRSEDTQRAGTGAIALSRTVCEHALHEIEIAAHERSTLKKKYQTFLSHVRDSVMQ
jgi:hypothetical protein